MNGTMIRSEKETLHPLVFQHIPKTAGVSVRSLISCNFHHDEILHVPDSRWTDAQFAADSLDRYGFIHGHLHFAFVEPLLERSAVITFLRDPVERVLSLYFFLQKQDPNAHPDSTVRYVIEQARELSPEQFALHAHPTIRDMVCNYQLRVLLSGSQQERPMEVWVETALRNLERYRFVGIADSDLISASVLAMSREFGWVAGADVPQVNHAFRNRSPRELSVAKEAIASRNGLEIALHGRVRQRLLGGMRNAEKPTDAQQNELARQRRRYRTGMASPVSMAEPLRCWGWHDRETGSNLQRHWRCGAHKKCGFELRVPSRRSLVILLEFSSVHPRIDVERTTISAGVRQLDAGLCLINGVLTLAALVGPEDVSDDGIVALDIACEEREAALECDEVVPADDRYVTLALSSIEILTEVRVGDVAFRLIESAIAALRKKMEREIQIERHSAALLDRAERAESYGRSLALEVENRCSEARTLMATIERERRDAAAYQESLIDRAVRAENYCTSLHTEISRLQKLISTLGEISDENDAGREGVEESASKRQSGGAPENG